MNIERKYGKVLGGYCPGLYSADRENVFEQLVPRIALEHATDGKPYIKVHLLSLMPIPVSAAMDMDKNTILSFRYQDWRTDKISKPVLIPEDDFTATYMEDMAKTPHWYQKLVSS